MATRSKRSCTKAFEFGVNDLSLLQDHGKKKKVADGITAFGNFLEIDVKYIKGDDGIEDIKNSFLEGIPCVPLREGQLCSLYSEGLLIELTAQDCRSSKYMFRIQGMDIVDHKAGIIVTITVQNRADVLEGSECVLNFLFTDPEAIKTLKEQLIRIQQFYIATKSWIVLVNDQLVHLGENGTVDNYKIDDLLSVKIFESDGTSQLHDDVSTLAMMFLVGKGKEKRLKKIFFRTKSDNVKAIDKATRCFCKVPLEREMCDKTASPFDGRLWLLDQQRYQLLKQYFPFAMDKVEEYQDTIFDFSVKPVPGFRRSLFRKWCRAANKEDLKTVMRTSVLRHFSIVPVYACRLHSPNSMTVFSACLGYNLKELLDNGLLIWQQRVRVLYHVACAIAFLHKRTILHLDITSVNIVLDEYFNARLTDFGSSQVLPEGTEIIKCSDEQHAKQGRTNGYMPDKANLYWDKTVDYFNFGVVTRECLTGEHPTYECYHHHRFLRTEPLCLCFNKQRSVWQYNGGLKPNVGTIDQQFLTEHHINDEHGELFKHLLEDKHTDCGFEIVQRCEKKLATFPNVQKHRIVSLATDCVNHVYKLIDISRPNKKNGSIYKEILSLSALCLKWSSSTKEEADNEHSTIDLDFENIIKKTLWNILHDCNVQTWGKAPKDKTGSGQSDQVICEVCLLNKAHKDPDQILHNKSCQQRIKLCLSCIKSHYINPLECHSCTTCLPLIGGNNAMLLCVSGHGECERVFTNNVEDIENICKSLLHPTLCIRKTLTLEAPKMTMGDIENKIDPGINTLVFYFAGHGKPGNAKPNESVAHMIASETLNITAEDLESLAKKRDLETFIIIRDCCYPQKINEIRGCNLMQLSACYETEISSAGTRNDRNGPFTKYLKAALIVPNEECVPKCDHCETYYDRVNSAGVVKMEDIHKFIKAHYEKDNIIVNRCKPTPVMHLADPNTQTVSFSNSSKINLRIDGISDRTLSLTFQTNWEKFWDDAVDAYINECEERIEKESVHLVKVVDNSKVTDIQQLWYALQEKVPIRIVHEKRKQFGSEQTQKEVDYAKSQEEGGLDQTQTGRD